MENINWLKLGLFTIPILISSVLLISHGHTKEDFRRRKIILTLFGYLVLLVLPVLSGVIAFFYYDVQKVISIVIVAGIVILQLVARFTYNPNSEQDNNNIAALAGVLSIVLSLLVLISGAPNLINNRRPVSDTVTVDISQIDDSFRTIESSFRQIDDIIKEETRSIEVLIRKTREELQDKSKQLDKLNQEQALLKKELEHYKELASISEEQADALLEAFGRGKYLDYIVGLILGIISSIAATYIYTRMINKQ